FGDVSAHAKAPAAASLGEILLEEGIDLVPAIDGLLGPVRRPCGVEEAVAGAVIAVEFVFFAEPLERFLGDIDVSWGRVLVVVAVDAENRSGEIFRQCYRGHRPLLAAAWLFLAKLVAAPAIHHRIEPGQ